MTIDELQFDELIRRHARMVAAVIRRVCGRRHALLVPDVEQEVYLALWKRLGSGKEIEHPTSYLYKMALTTALALVRRHRRDAPVPENAEERLAAEAVSAETASHRRFLAQLLAALDPDEARALRAWLAGFNHVEIARLYGWSESVARHRIYRTLERLRRIAADDEKGKP